MALSPAVRVELEDELEGDDLLEALSVRGLSTRLVRDEDGLAVEVAAPEGEEGLWNLEIVAALEAWLERRERSFLVARVGSRSYTVRAPGAEPLPRDPIPSPSEPSDKLSQGIRELVPVVAAAVAVVLLVAAAVWLFLAAAG